MVLVTAAIVASLAVPESQSPTLDDVLRRSARYVAEYQVRLSSVVAEERYEQRVESKKFEGINPFGVAGAMKTDRQKRLLRSDYLLVRARGRNGWIPFRDVFEVNGKPVRDRGERLTRLFLDSPATAWDQAEAIVEESTRFNIGTVLRTINAPTLGLVFLIAENQPRFEFLHDDTRRDAGRESWEISYHEHGRPTLIRGQGGADLPAFGTFWIDANDGRVLRSLLRTDDGDLRSEIEVTYEPDNELGLWVPASMREQYRTSAGETIEGTATYGHFRQFNVKTSERTRIR